MNPSTMLHGSIPSFLNNGKNKIRASRLVSRLGLSAYEEDAASLHKLRNQHPSVGALISLSSYVPLATRLSQPTSKTAKPTRDA